MKTKFTLLFLFIFLIAGLTHAQNVLTHAGTPTKKGHNPAGVDRLKAYLNEPHGMVFDSKGNLWFTNEGGHTVSVIIKNDKTLYTRSGAYNDGCLKPGSGVTSKYNNPSGMAIGSGDTIYIADRYNHVIRKLHPLVTLSAVQQSDIYAGKYSYVNLNDKCYKTYPGHKDGSLTKAQFMEPTDVTIDPSGNLYVADFANHCIRKIDPSGNVTTYAGQAQTSGNDDGDKDSKAKFNYPFSVEYYDGDLYVVDKLNGAIRKIDMTTEKVSTLNIAFPNIWHVHNIYIHSNGDMYYSDGARVMKHDFATEKTNVFAGTTIPQDTGGFKNDTGTAAKFNQVRALVVDPKNNRYVYAADQNNHLIRRMVICDAFKPDVTITGKTTTCTGDSVVLEADAGYKSYLWSSGEKTARIVVTKQGNYNLTCTVQNDDECYGVSDPISIKINRLTPNVTPDGPLSFCTGGSVLLVGQSGLDKYEWKKDGTTVLTGTQGTALSYKATESGDYVLYGTSGPCTGPSKTMKVRIDDHITPSIEVTYGDTNLCDGNVVRIQTVSPYSSYKWKKNGTDISGGTSRELAIEKAGSYSVFVVDNNTQCDGESYPVTVTLRPSPPKPTVTQEVSGNDTILKSSATSGNQWTYYNTPIAGATKQTYTIDKPGEYRVEVTNAEGCTSVSDKWTNTSIAELGIKDFQVYPNPNNGQFTISATYIPSDQVNISIIDILGHIVFNSVDRNIKPNYTREIDVTNLEKGIYFLRISADGKQNTKKIIVE